MPLLHPLPISGGSNLNQILQPVGSANLPNVHFTNAFPSRVGGITGYEGAGGSVAALAGNPGFKLVMKGGSTFMRRTGGGSKSRRRGSMRCKCRKTMRGGAKLPFFWQQVQSGIRNLGLFTQRRNLQKKPIRRP
jgi:hypothetical protein